MKHSVVCSVVAVVLSVPVVANAGTSAACTAGRIELEAGSTVDLGTTGVLHSAELVAGSAIGFAIASRCSDDDSSCSTNADCESDLCVATCDCESDTTCEITGPVGNRRCLTTLAECRSDEDCSGGVPCVPFFAPPQPLEGGGVPVCLATSIEGPVEGEIDTENGEVSLSGRLRWRIFLGISLETPCPRCGTGDDVRIGDDATCEGGQRNGLACTVDGVTKGFGGVSYDCPPALAANVSGAGVIAPLFDVTTQTAAKTASLPCSSFGLTANPLVPGSNPKCTDAIGPEDPVCTSNADCMRCSGNPDPCTTNDDCTGAGPCAEAPDQPVTCGYWCHCGFCDGSATQPCMEDADCPAEQACIQGTAMGTSPGLPQRLPNECSGDAFICGTAAEETCESTASGTCSLAPAKPCDDDGDCVAEVEGTCHLSPRECFEPRIAREGEPSPVGTYCAIEAKACDSNADCTQPDDACANRTARPSLAGLSCTSNTSSAIINGMFGLTGPAAFDWQTRLVLCACEEPAAGCEDVCIEPGCGDGIVQEEEDCDGGACCTPECTFESQEVVCRGSAGTCDEAESCSGSAAACPPDASSPDGTPCDDETDCTIADECTAGQCFGTTGCGDGEVDGECGEECDDGNTANGDGCSETCGPETLCGDATADGEIMTSDAQRALQKAVGIDVQCDLAVCDVDSSGSVQTNDALRILRAAVELEVELVCSFGS